MSAPTQAATPLAPGAAAPRSGRRSGPRRGSLTHPARTGLLLVAPAVLFVVVFVFTPLVLAVGMSFTNFPLIGPFHWIGFENFASVLTDPTFWGAVGYTVLYTAIVTGPILVLGCALAVLVRANRRGSTFLRTMIFLPYVIGLTTLSFLTVLETQPNSGMVNVVLKALGLSDGTTAWLVSGPLGTIILCALVIWAVPGLTMVLIMSGMQGIPRELYESAEIDGATWWQRERLITIPMLRRTIAMVLIISVIGSFLAFTQFYILTAGGPGSSTTPVVLAIYRRAFVQLQLGYATAMSVVLVIITGLVTAAQFWLLREKD